MVRAVDNGCRPTLGLEVIAGLLQVESPLSKAALRESLMPRQKLAEVLVSEALLAGHQVGALGLSLLDLHRTRSQYYAFIVDRLPSSPSVLKGSMVARHYPSGVTRGLVDLDLLCRNENEFWRCAAAVQGIMSAHPLMATWPIGERNHFVVAYETPSQGSVFEAPYRIELSTNALPGNFIDMPSREVPWDYSSNHSPAYDLLLLAEEQFQRGVIGRDVVDVVYLLRAMAPEDLAVLDSLAKRAELVAQVRTLLQHPTVQRFVNCAAEWDARLATNPDRPVASAQALAAPQQAILLDKLVPAGWAPAAREGEVGSRTVGDVLLTPLGPFALTTSGTIEEDWLEEMTDLAKRHWGDYVHI